MKSFYETIMQLPKSVFKNNNLQIRPIRDDNDLWYATVECKLAPGQEDLVNPAGFSIGRAYLNPNDHVPCVIVLNEVRIGYIMLRKWYGSNAVSWSYYLDAAHQGKGNGKTAANLAVHILKTAFPHLPIKLSAEQNNEKAHRLYKSIGFEHKGEMDYNDLVFEL